MNENDDTDNYDCMLCTITSKELLNRSEVIENEVTEDDKCSA